MFLFFEPFCPRLNLKFAISANMIYKKIIFTKMQYGYKKSQNLMLISNSLKKLNKNSIRKKLLIKTWRRHFFTFTHVRQFVLLITFLCEFFMKLFQRILNQCEILHFFIHILNI
jgi:hypothetical protein